MKNFIEILAWILFGACIVMMIVSIVQENNTGIIVCCISAFATAALAINIFIERL
jgi:hypothetical protein